MMNMLYVCICLCSCECVHMHVSMHAHVYMCIHGYSGQEPVAGVFSIILHLIFEAGSLSELEADSVRLAGSKPPQGWSCRCMLCLGYYVSIGI